MNSSLTQELDWEAIRIDWHQFKALAKRRWDRLGEQQLHAVGGRRDFYSALGDSPAQRLNYLMTIH